MSLPSLLRRLFRPRLIEAGIDTPLGAAELKELDALLRVGGGHQDNFGLAYFDGVITCAAIGPALIQPREWLDCLFPRGFPREGEQLQSMLALMQRHMNAVLAGFAREPAQFRPLFLRLGESVEDCLAVRLAPSVESWCHGFMVAAQLHRARWERLLDPLDIESPLFVPWLFGTASGDQMRSSMAAKEDMPANEFEESCANRLRQVIPAMREYWWSGGTSAQPRKKSPSRKRKRARARRR